MTQSFSGIAIRLWELCKRTPNNFVEYSLETFDAANTQAQLLTATVAYRTSSNNFMLFVERPSDGDLSLAIEVTPDGKLYGATDRMPRMDTGDGPFEIPTRGFEFDGLSGEPALDGAIAYLEVLLPMLQRCGIPLNGPRKGR